MRLLKDAAESFLHLLFPHLCAGCGTDNINKMSSLCLRCLRSLPATGFSAIAGNPVEKKFWGRLEIQAATAQFYFARSSVIQELMHALKYKGDQELGLQLGRLMGISLAASNRFVVDSLVALPLFKTREKKRGYNQSALLCQGISESTGIPVLNDIIYRAEQTDTQTHMNRVNRWQNMEGKFIMQDVGRISNKHLLLVDDVITTGATLEACGAALVTSGCRLSVAALCYADH
jgi:ComF family protein